MVKRNVYLQMKSRSEALRIFMERFDWQHRLSTEEVSVSEAVGRVLAEPVTARRSSPAYHGSAMDGVAVKAESTWGASDAAPRELALGREAFPVDTGDPLPPGTDAVIMIEHVQKISDDRIRIEAPAHPFQHVRKVGEDIVATEMLFTRHHRVTPYCIGALLAAGVTNVTVKRRPRILILPTGAEMIPPEAVADGDLAPGLIIESNATMLGKMVEACGGEYVRLEPVADDVDAIAGAILAAVEEGYDLVMTIGGSSAGSEDYSKEVIGRIGEVLVHGVTMMPGKPTLLSAVNDRPVVGIPGYPVSAIMAFEELVAPALAKMLGASRPERPTAVVHPTRKIASKLGMEELVRVRLGRVGEKIVAAALPRGAGTVSSITEADGILRIGAELEGLRAGEPCVAELLRPLSEIDKHLVAVGSHDLCLDLIADLLRAGGSGVALSSSHVGSIGGLLAIKNGGCHLAGAHLLDPDDGSYNLSYVRRYLPDRPVKLVTLVERQQGLMVQAGNPRGIQGIEDLARGDVRFVNRQSGSGTRILLDHELGKAGISAESIQGYGDEEVTHMTVAVAVASGTADAGLGIKAAARAMSLDFIPVVLERYDLIIPEDLLETPAIEAALQVVRSEKLRRRIDGLGGYRTTSTGKLVS